MKERERRGLGFYIQRAFPLDESELDKVRGVTKGNCTREREREEENRTVSLLSGLTLME